MPNTRLEQDEGIISRKVAENLYRIYNRGPVLNSAGLFDLLDSFQNPDRVGIDTYEKMIDTDETCSSGIEFVKLSAISRIGGYSHPVEEISRFVNAQFERVRGSISQVLDGMLGALWSGFSAGEMILEYYDGFIQLRDVQFVHPGQLSFQLHSSGPLKNRVSGVSILGDIGESVEIPVEKLLIYTHRERFGNPYGISRLKSVYSDYFVKKQMIVNWARTLEKYGSPTAVGRVEDPDAVITDEQGNRMTQLEYMAKVLDSIQTATGVALSGSSQISFLEHGTALGGDFESAVVYFNRMIYRGLLIPSLVGDHGSTGSQALGRTHFDLFILSLEQLVREVTDTLIDQLVRRLITWNFGPQEDWGQFNIEQFKAEDARLFAGIFREMTSAGYLSPERFEDMQHVRCRIGAPGISHEHWEEQVSVNREHQDDSQHRMAQFRQSLNGLLSRFEVGCDE